jgi:hypothetical protein
MKRHLNMNLNVSLFFFQYWAWIQGLMFTRQTLYPLSHKLSPNVSIFSWSVANYSRRGCSVKPKYQQVRMIRVLKKAASHKYKPDTPLFACASIWEPLWQVHCAQIWTCLFPFPKEILLSCLWLMASPFTNFKVRGLDIFLFPRHSMGHHLLLILISKCLLH